MRRSWPPSPPQPRTLAELVAATGLPRATAHRLAVALEVHRLVARDVEGRFVLGPRVGELATALPDALVAAAGPVLAWVRDECGESAQLYRRDGVERVCVAAAERATGLRTTVPVGSRLPLTAGSGAQVLCAWSAGRSASDFTPRLLAEVRRRGWAQSVAQREAGVASVSAPVLTSARRAARRDLDLGPDRAAGPHPGPALRPRARRRRPPHRRRPRLTRSPLAVPIALPAPRVVSSGRSGQL